MYQKRKYKHFILLCLVLDLLTMVFLGYRYLDRKIPDEIHIDKKFQDLTFPRFPIFLLYLSEIQSLLPGKAATNCLADFLEK